ncbi:MAG: MT-A70 family methyltransferase, partial [Cetobacterium sp.]
EGIREPILLWNNQIIDGHNRYSVATKHNLEFKTTEKQFDSEKEVKEYMILNQFGRRNLSNYQRSILALELEDIFKVKAKENHTKNAIKTLNKLNNAPASATLPTPVEKINTRAELSKIANVGDRTMGKVKKIRDEASEEMKQKLEQGTVSINEAYNQMKREKELETAELEFVAYTQKDILEKAKELRTESSKAKKEARKELIEQQVKDIEEGKLPELSGKFDIVSIDPPWPYGREYDPETSRVANPYPEMTIEMIENIKLPTTDDSIIFLWTTHMFLPNSFEILKKWGYEYKATLVWNKERIGMGAWFRMQCEFCLVAIKGKPYFENTRYRDIFSVPRREHSRKPDEFFKMVTEITAGRRLEYFSREKREGWEIYGNDTEKF